MFTAKARISLTNLYTIILVSIYDPKPIPNILEGKKIKARNVEKIITSNFKYLIKSSLFSTE
jgi:hypothetical protein